EAQHGEQEGLAEELYDELAAGAAKGFADADLAGAAGGVGRGEVDKIDAPQGQQEDGYQHQAIKGGFMGCAVIKGRVEWVEVEIAEGLQVPAIAAAWPGVDGVFFPEPGELALYCRGLDAGRQLEKAFGGVGETAPFVGIGIAGIRMGQGGDG